MTTYDDTGFRYDEQRLTYDGVLLPPGRYRHVVQCAFGTMPPNDPADNSVPGSADLPGFWTPGTVWTPMWSQNPAIPVGGNGLRSYTSTRTSQNSSSGQAEPGTATIVLDNANGWLDPTNPFSPYHGYLVPGTPIRVLITDGNGNYWREWQGFVKDWPLSPNAKGAQDATVACYDALGWLGSAPALWPTELHHVTLTSGPVAYWPHDDIGSTSDVRDIVSGWDAHVQGTAALSGPSLTIEGIGASAAFPNQPTACVQAPPVMPPAPWTVSILVRIFSVALGGGDVPTYWYAGDVASGTAGVYFGPQDVIVWNSSFPGRGAAWKSDGTVLDPGLYMLTVTYDQFGTLTSWLNGAQVIASPGPFEAPYLGNGIRWGSALRIAGPGDTSQGAQISHVAIWNRVLSPGEIAARANAALVGRAGEGTVLRAGYLLDRVGWPAAKRVFPGFGTGWAIIPSNATCGPLSLSATQADPTGHITSRSTLDLLKDVAQLEDAVIGVDASGNFMWVGRHQNPAPSFAVGGDNAPKESAAYSRKDLTVVTSCAVGRPPMIYSSGQALYNGYQVIMQGEASSADEAWLIGERAVALGSQPRNTIDTVTFDPVDTPVSVLLDLGDTGTVTRRPIWWTADDIGIAEAMQVTSVSGSGGGGQPLKRTFSMIEPRLVRWSARSPSNPGAATGFTTPASAGFDTADLNVAAQFRVDNWATTGAIQTLVSHVGAGGVAGWIFAYDTTGPVPVLALYWTDSGGASHSASSSPVVRTGRRYIWAAVNFVPLTGAVTFALSFGNIYETLTWGTASVGATSLRVCGGPIEIGCWNGSHAQLAGDVYAAYVSTAANVPVAQFNPTRDAQPAVAGSPTPPASWTAAGTGETWSAQGAGILLPS